MRNENYDDEECRIDEEHFMGAQARHCVPTFQSSSIASHPLSSIGTLFEIFASTVKRKLSLCANTFATNGCSHAHAEGILGLP